MQNFDNNIEKNTRSRGGHHNIISPKTTANGGSDLAKNLSLGG